VEDQKWDLGTITNFFDSRSEQNPLQEIQVFCYHDNQFNILVLDLLFDVVGEKSIMDLDLERLFRVEGQVFYLFEQFEQFFLTFL